MTAITTVAVMLIAVEHLGFLYLEMFLWAKPIGIKIFHHTKEDAEKSKVLAANQGLYNGFICAGLIWGLVHPNTEFGIQIILFFLTCAAAAGIYGGITANKTILYIQALPAIFTTVLVATIS